MELNEYYAELEKHDWFHQYSDDHKARREGELASKRLALAAGQSPEHKSLWERFNNYVFSGSNWGTEKMPKPRKPGS